MSRQRIGLARHLHDHAFLLERMLAHIVDLESDIAAVQERIEEAVAPFGRHIEVTSPVTVTGASSPAVTGSGVFVTVTGCVRAEGD